METLQFLLENVPKSALLESACGLSQWMVSSTLRTDSPLTTVCNFTCLGKIILTRISVILLNTASFTSLHILRFSFQMFKYTAELESRMIKRGMETIERGTCVKFVPRTHQEDFIDIKPKSGWVFPLRNIKVTFVCKFKQINVQLPTMQVLVLPWCSWWKADYIPPEPWLPPAGSDYSWIHARSGLCARAVPLWQGQICHHHVAKHLEGYCKIRFS